MIANGAVTRGRPLMVLALVIVGWAAIRVVAWESPFAAETVRLADGPTQIVPSNMATSSSAVGTVRENGENPTPAPALPSDYLGRLLDTPASPLAWQENAAPELMENPDVAAGHQLMWMAAMAHLPVPKVLKQRIIRAPLPPGPNPAAQSKQDRWSLDAWVFWREGSGGPAIAQGRVPSYGASQAAAVLRYRLAPTDNRDPRAYARIYRALVDRGENEIAIGLSARPLVSLPIRAHAEVRTTERSSDVEFRPSVFVTSELPPIELPVGFRAEVYAQAGYVAGNNATAFADGQLHLLRDLERFDLGRISLGGAAWGGAQEGAQRLDVGPSLRFDAQLEQTPARVSLDYRERVAGNAEPQSGVALTISSRF